MKYQLRSDEGVAICNIVSDKLIAQLLSLDGEWVQKIFFGADGISRYARCYVLADVDTKVIALKDVVIYLNNDYYLRPIDN